MARTAGDAAGTVTGCVILAAGSGRRFGGPKQIARLDGRPVLQYALDLAAGSPVDSTVLVLGSQADEVLGAVDLRGAEPLVCTGWREGMAAGLRGGIAALGEAATALVLLGDQPLITPRAVERVLARGRFEPAVRASYDGVPGHPVALGRELFPAVMRLRGDVGARTLLANAATVACEDIADPLDVDTPADLRLAEHVLAS